MTLEFNIFHLNKKHMLLEDENQVTDEVGSIGQHAGKLSVQALQEMTNQGAAGVLVLPSVPTEEQLLNSPSISENQNSKGKANNKESTQATVGVEEIILIDPP